MSNSPSPVPFRTGRNVFLCPLDASFESDLYQWINDQEVHAGLTIVRPMTRANEHDFIVSASDGKSTTVEFGIVRTKTQKLIGTVGLHDVKWVHHTATAGISIGDKTQWGKGYGTEAMMLLLEYAFNTLNLRKVSADVYDFNLRSQGHLKNCGYVEEGLRKEHVYRNGRYADVHEMAVFKEDFLPVWKKFASKKPHITR